MLRTLHELKPLRPTGVDGMDYMDAGGSSEKGKKKERNPETNGNLVGLVEEASPQSRTQIVQHQETT